jgi:polyribonucleotide 5'-hydroxyl-kinase
MKALRHSQIRAYFFGYGENALAPHSQAANYDDLSIFKISESMFYSHLIVTLKD